MKSNNRNNRRSFLRNSVAMSTATVAGGVLASGVSALAREEGSGSLNKGDAALLRFAAAAEILETDLWVQYNELAGIQDGEEPDGSGNPAYHDAVAQLDEDMDQYIHDNTEDERTHFTFLNAYLVSKR